MRSKPAAMRRFSSFGPQPIKFPSHYVFLLIPQVMVSSPLLQPSRDIGGGIVERAILHARIPAR